MDGTQHRNRKGPCLGQLGCPKVGGQKPLATLNRSPSKLSDSNRSFWHHPIPSPTASATHRILRCNRMGNSMSSPAMGPEQGLELALGLGPALGEGLALEALEAMGLLLGTLSANASNNKPSWKRTIRSANWNSQQHNHRHETLLAAP